MLRVIAAGIGPFGQDPACRVLRANLGQQGGKRNARPFTAAQQAVRVLRRPARPGIAIFWCVPGTFQEVQPRDRRKAQDIVHGQDERPIHQPVDEQSMRIRVDLRNSGVVAFVVQAVRCDDAMQVLQWRTGGGGGGERHGASHAADDVAFEWRGNAVGMRTRLGSLVRASMAARRAAVPRLRRGLRRTACWPRRPEQRRPQEDRDDAISGGRPSVSFPSNGSNSRGADSLDPRSNVAWALPEAIPLAAGLPRRRGASQPRRVGIATCTSHAQVMETANTAGDRVIAAHEAPRQCHHSILQYAIMALRACYLPLAAAEQRRGTPVAASPWQRPGRRPRLPVALLSRSSADRPPATGCDRRPLPHGPGGSSIRSPGRTGHLLGRNASTLRANDDETPDPREFRLEGAEGSPRTCPCSSHQSMPTWAPPRPEGRTVSGRGGAHVGIPRII